MSSLSYYKQPNIYSFYNDVEISLIRRAKLTDRQPQIQISMFEFINQYVVAMTLKKFNWTEHDGRSSKNVQKRKMAKQFSHNGKSKK